MKKKLSFVLVLLLGLILVACNGTVEDTEKPVISGVGNITYEIGDPAPNWLEGVTATDNVDENVTVTVDASAVKLDEAGTYDLIYKATDSAGNEATRTVRVTVVAKDTEAPVITGAKDITLDKGSTKPNWLSGVNVTDNIDNNPTLTVDDSAVKLDELGTYDLVYKAEDSSGNKSEVTVKVIVIEPVLEETVVFATDPYNKTATTSVSGVGVALYFDATESGEEVLLQNISFVVESAPEGATGNNAAVIALEEDMSIYYLRAFVAGEYEIKLTVKDAFDRNVSAPTTHKITVSQVSTNQAEDKVKIRNIYPTNISANPDYRDNEGTNNEFLIVGKDFTLFRRHEPYYGTNYAAAFIGFADFDGGEPLDDFTISFSYKALTKNWKTLFSMFSGNFDENDNLVDGFSGDWIRILPNRDQIGIINDTDQGSEHGDEGEAKDIVLDGNFVHIKVTRQIEGTTATFKLYTSTDGIDYTLEITAVTENASTESTGIAAKLTGIAIFSIDQDFVIKDLNVTGTVFSLED